MSATIFPPLSGDESRLEDGDKIDFGIYSQLLILSGSYVLIGEPLNLS